MKNCLTIFFFAIFFIAACKDAPKTETTQTTPPTAPVAPPAAPETRCYLKKDGKDITAIELTMNGSEITGYYSWEPYEKDGAIGMFKGKKEGDIITADLSYMIEGNIEKEEIMLKVANDSISQASNELEDKGGKMVIKDKTKLVWQEVLKKVDCSEISTSMQNAKEVSESIKNPN